MLRWPVDPMRAAGKPALPAARTGATRIYEPKWDGFRAIAWITAAGARIQSRQAKDLTKYLPDLAAALAHELPVGAVLDGEVLIWDPDRGRSSFTLLQRRLTAGRRIHAEAAKHPAHYVGFDLLQDGRGHELLDQPLWVRRRKLERLLANAGTQLPVCPQTDDRAVAVDWCTDLGVAGVEGVVVKNPLATYVPGKIGWSKVRSKNTADYILAGVTGSHRNPTALLLGRYDQHQTLRYVAHTHPLKAGQRREVAALLQPMVFQGDLGHPWPQPLPPAWSLNLGDRQPLPYVQVEPTLVAEVLQDTAVDGPFAKARHLVWHVRVRPDLHPRDVGLISAVPPETKRAETR